MTSSELEEKYCRGQMLDLTRDRGEGRKDDQGKLEWTLVPWAEMEEVVRVLMHGAEHYAPHNWQKVPNGYWRYMNAIMRHWEKVVQGEAFDKDTKMKALAHIVCDALFAMWFANQGDVTV
jgi:hypothetical protein